MRRPTNTQLNQPSSLSRRKALAGLAVLPAALPAALAAEPDPIFAAIDAFKQVDAACVAVEGDIPDELGDQHDAAFKLVLRTRPTTPAGLVAFTTWAREQANSRCANGSLLYGEDFCILSATIDAAVRDISGLKPWSRPSQRG